MYWRPNNRRAVPFAVGNGQSLKYMLDISLDTHLNTFHLSLEFCAEIGKTTVLLGESGAGKTVVLPAPLSPSSTVVLPISAQNSSERWKVFRCVSSDISNMYFRLCPFPTANGTALLLFGRQYIIL